MPLQPAPRKAAKFEMYAGRLQSGAVINALGIPSDKGGEVEELSADIHFNFTRLSRANGLGFSSGDGLYGVRLLKG